MTMDNKSVKKIVRLWREVNKEKMIIIGGPISSDKNLLNKIDADISVVGEGESKICSIIEILLNVDEKLSEEYYNKLKNINGISFRYNGTPFFTKPSLNLEEFIDIKKMVLIK